MTQESSEGLTTPTPPSSLASELKRSLQLSVQEQYNQLYNDYMNLQRMFALLLLQKHDGHITIFDDPSNPRLFYLHSVRLGDRFDVTVTGGTD